MKVFVRRLSLICVFMSTIQLQAGEIMDGAVAERVNAFARAKSILVAKQYPDAIIDDELRVSRLSRVADTLLDRAASAEAAFDMVARVGVLAKLGGPAYPAARAFIDAAGRSLGLAYKFFEIERNAYLVALRDQDSDDGHYLMHLVAGLDEHDREISIIVADLTNADAHLKQFWEAFMRFVP